MSNNQNDNNVNNQNNNNYNQNNLNNNEFPPLYIDNIKISDYVPPPEYTNNSV